MNPISTLLDHMHAAAVWENEIILERNAYLKVKGSIDTNLYFVQSGSLRIFVIDAEEEHTIRFGYQHNLIAALDSFLNGKPSEFYIQALKKTVLKSVSKEKYTHFITSSEEMKQLWLVILENFVLQQMERERDILTSSPLERYQRVLQRSPQLFQEIPHKYIASYLRMTPETLSRIKKS
ncbi:MAG: Crp/Fnr family transcriptional regulator [Bacteroidota bacterium]